MAKTIKIPSGQIRLILPNGNGFDLSDVILLEALNDYGDKLKKKYEQELSTTTNLTYDPIYDDDNPDYIKQSAEEI